MHFDTRLAAGRPREMKMESDGEINAVWDGRPVTVGLPGGIRRCGRTSAAERSPETSLVIGINEERSGELYIHP